MPNPKRPPGTVVVPPNAATWTLAQLYVDENKKNRRRKCKTDPLEDGSVPEMWAADEFSERNVLTIWGPGRYRVDFYDAAGEHCSGHARVFEVAHPTASATKLGKRPPRNVTQLEDPESPARPGAAAAGGQQFGMMEFFAMQQQLAEAARDREDRLAQRMREEAREQRESDRAFMQSLVGMVSSGAGGGGGGGANFDLLRREMAVSVREQMGAIRRDLATDLLGGRTPDGGDGEDDPEPPRDMVEGASRIGLAMLGELEARAPEMLQEAIPAIVGFLKGKGFLPSPALQAQIEAHRAAANGGGHA